MIFKVLFLPSIPMIMNVFLMLVLNFYYAKMNWINQDYSLFKQYEWYIQATYARENNKLNKEWFNIINAYKIIKYIIIFKIINIINDDQLYIIIIIINK